MLSHLRSSIVATVAALAFAIPTASAEGAHEGESADLNATIEFLDRQLTTTVGPGGTSFGGGAPDPAFTYPQAFWGSFAGYYIGTTMHFRVTLENTAAQGNKTFNLTVSAASNAVELNGSDGVAIGAPQQWSVTGLAPGQTQVVEGSVAITGANIPVGLDVTRITLSHPNQGGDPTAGIIKVCTGIWCPPPSANN
jgi:hypothetical protein